MKSNTYGFVIFVSLYRFLWLTVSCIGYALFKLNNIVRFSQHIIIKLYGLILCNLLQLNTTVRKMCVKSYTLHPNLFTSVFYFVFQCNNVNSHKVWKTIFTQVHYPGYWPLAADPVQQSPLIHSSCLSPGAHHPGPVHPRWSMPSQS